MSETVDLDVRRMLCPMPVIRTQERVKTLVAGDRLVVHCTDPGVLHDIPAWCRINGHTVIATANEGDEIIVTLEVGSD